MRTKITAIITRIVFIASAALVLTLCQSFAFAQGTPADLELVGQRQPRAGTPEVGLSDAAKLKQGAEEMNYFEKSTQHINFVASPQVTRGQRYTIYEDPRDPFLAVKRAGVINGIRILTDRGIRIPSNLKVYLTDKSINPELGPGCIDAQGKPIYVKDSRGAVGAKCISPKTIAFKRGRRFEPVANIIISTIEKTPGALSGTGYNGLDKTSITIIHEIGHILHERHAGEFFWTRALIGLPAIPSISGYAETGKKEFVAEVFTALVLGMPNLNRYSGEYKRLREPDAYLFVLR